MNKEQMIAYMKKEGITLDDFGIGENLNGWTCKMGAFEFFLENRDLAYEGIIASSIYESDLV